MSQVILIHKENEFSQLLELNLELYVGATVVYMTRAEKAIDLMQKLPRIDLIICANEIGHESSAMEVYKYLQKYERPVPLLVMGYNHKLYKLKKKIFMTKELNDWQAIIRASAKILGITPKEVSERPVPEFYPLDLKYFQSVNSVGCDVYIRISKGKKKGFQYIKRFRADEPYETEIIEKYQKHGVEFLYVEKDNRLLFANHFTEKIIQKLKEKEQEERPDASITSDAYYAFYEEIRRSGLNDKSIELAQATIASMRALVEKCEELTKLYQMLIQSKGNFLFNHSLLIAYVGHHVLDKLLMGTKETRNAFIFVAFFHDITLKEEKYAMLEHERELADLKLELTDKNEVLSHAKLASQLLKEFPQVPLNAPMAIQQHHCTLDGIGYIDYPGDRIIPLAQVFRVVEDFVISWLKANAHPEAKEQIINRLKLKYTKHTYKEAVNVLIDLK